MSARREHTRCSPTDQLIQFRVLEVFLNTQHCVSLLFVFSHHIVDAFKEVVALGVNINHKGAQLIKIHMPGGFDGAQLVKELHIRDVDLACPQIGADALIQAGIYLFGWKMAIY